MNLDSVALYAPITKWSVEVEDPNTIPDILANAFRMRHARIDVDVTSKLHMEVPDCGGFFDANLAQDHSQAIKETEG